MRVMYVTPYIPSHIRVRPYQLIKALSHDHEISLVALLCDNYEHEMVQDIAQYCTSVDLITLPKWQAYANCLKALPTLMPLRVAYYQSSSFVQCLREVIRKQRIEVIHGELIKVAPMLRTLQKEEHLPLIYDAVDCISCYLKQQWASVDNCFKQAFIYSELKKMEYFEPHLLSTFEHVVITSPYDKELLQAFSERLKHIHVIPNGVDTAYFTPRSQARIADSLVFCAKLDYYPNNQAILLFCQQILPLVWQRRPQVRLTIVGNNPPPAVRALSVDKRIVVTGYVPDIRPYLASAAVALSPLVVAAGMQNKVLEAMAMGTPMVATPVSCRSLQTVHEKHLLIADGPQAFAYAIIHLLENSHLAEKLGTTGQEYVLEKHSWWRAARILSTLYQSITHEQESSWHQLRVRNTRFSSSRAQRQVSEEG